MDKQTAGQIKLKGKKAFRSWYRDNVPNNNWVDKATNKMDEKEPELMLYDEMEETEIKENYTVFQSKFRRHYLSNERMTFRQFLEKVEDLIDELI